MNIPQLPAPDPAGFLEKYCPELARDCQEAAGLYPVFVKDQKVSLVAIWRAGEQFGVTRGAESARVEFESKKRTLADRATRILWMAGASAFTAGVLIGGLLF